MYMKWSAILRINWNLGRRTENQTSNFDDAGDLLGDPGHRVEHTGDLRAGEAQGGDPMRDRLCGLRCYLMSTRRETRSIKNVCKLLQYLILYQPSPSNHSCCFIFSLSHLMKISMWPILAQNHTGKGTDTQTSKKPM